MSGLMRSVGEHGAWALPPEVRAQAQARADRLSSWPLGTGFDRLAPNVRPLSLVTGTGVLREYPIWLSTLFRPGTPLIWNGAMIDPRRRG